MGAMPAGKLRDGTQFLARVAMQLLRTKGTNMERRTIANHYFKQGNGLMSGIPLPVDDGKEGVPFVRNIDFVNCTFHPNCDEPNARYINCTFTNCDGPILTRPQLPHKFSMAY